jgi:hypothetical protein
LSDLIGLLLCTLVVVVTCIAICLMVSHRIAKRSSSDEPASALPDFAVVDCGDQIHFVPLRENGHVVSGGTCDCHPRRTANRRRAGGRVVYVDHQHLRPRRLVVH